MSHVLTPPSFCVGALQEGHGRLMRRMALRLARSALAVRRAYMAQVSDGGWAVACTKQKGVEQPSHTMAGRVGQPSTSLAHDGFGHSLWVGEGREGRGGL